MFNLSVLKTVGFWVAVVTGIVGILLSQHVIADGSTVAQVLGWLLTLLGAGGTGHQIASSSTTAAQ